MDPDICARLLAVIEHRHSSRAPFDPSWRVTEREIARLVQAARSAPTANDMQNFRLIVIDDPLVLEQLAAVSRDGSPPLGETIAGAPLVIVVLYDPTVPEAGSGQLGMISLGCVMENVWLAAQAEGLDVQIVSTFAAESVQDEIKRVLAVPAQWRAAFAMRLGHVVAESRSSHVHRPIERLVGRNHF